MICGGPSGSQNKGGCTGDSGGPLSYKNPDDNKWYVVGIASFVGESCGVYTAFTKVSAYKDWIQQTMRL